MLAHQRLAAKGSKPDRVMLFLHGILGRGQNWRSVARRFVEGRPGWEAVLVDLRLHGDSRGVPGPHTLSAAAADLERLARSLDRPVRGVLGHSFGGKVALTWASQPPPSLDELWLVDSPPGARPEQAGSDQAVRVLEALGHLDGAYQKRGEFVEALRARGFSEELGTWLATQLSRGEDGAYRLDLDLDGIGALLDDHLQKDLWAQVENPPGHHDVHVVVGSDSDVFSRDDRARVSRAAKKNARVHLHVIEGAGHWVHVDALDALCDLLTHPPRPAHT